MTRTGIIDHEVVIMMRKTTLIVATFLALTSLLLPSAFAQATLQTFDDKAALLAATGATNATGTLPNLGPVSNTTVGSITFSRPFDDSGTMYIGTLGVMGPEGVIPYWYPPIPVNFIALRHEDFEAQTAAPVFSMGFEMVEPSAATMPSWSEIAGPSTFLVTLYSGATQVGQFTFDAPDDVLAFVGVWSNAPFNRVTITDSTGNDDDEYFGQFYT